MSAFEIFELVGSRGQKYSVKAKVVATDAAQTTFLLEDGRTIRVPNEAVATVVVRPSDNVEPPRPQAKSTRASTSPNRQSSRGDRSRRKYLSVLNEIESAPWTRTQAGISPGEDGQSGELLGRVEWLLGRLEALTHTALNRQQAALVSGVTDVCRALIQRLVEPDMAQAKDLRRRFLVACEDVRAPRPNVRISAVLHRQLEWLRQQEEGDWAAFSKRFAAHPHIEAPRRPSVNVDRNGEFYLPLRVVLDGGDVPATGVRVVLDQFRGAEVVGQAPIIEKLEPGQAKAVRVRLVDRRRQGASPEVKVRAHLCHVGPNNETLTSAHQRFSITLQPRVEFVEIANPFRDYASGVPVDDPDMFFGREAMLEEIVNHLTRRPLGRCYGLYGQKRSGKSSLIGQVRSTIDPSEAIVCQLSMGTIDRTAITTSFVNEVLDQLRENLATRLSSGTFANLLTRWPEPKEIAASPLASFRKAGNATRALLRRDGQSEPRIILIVDEFTYLYELLRRDHVAPADQHQLRDFMRQWKGWLEAKLFSALIVGQDTMPAFLNAFANEFSVMHIERLDYLSPTETESLADNPIRKSDGSSRFTGFALPRIHEYTGGHPFFTQIVCDRIVTLANEQRRTDVSDFDVDAAIQTLLAGPP